LTAGRVPFGDGTSAFGSSANLFWDNANNQLDLAAGTRTVPALSTVGDSNTGLFFPAADTVAISTAGEERVRVNNAGQVGIGLTPIAGQSLSVARNITGSVFAMGIRSVGVIQSDVTTQARGIDSSVGTAAATFTLGSLAHYYAAQGTFGANSTVTTQTGYFAENNLLGATTNYAFFASNSAAITTGKTHYAFYAGNNTATGGGTTYNFYAAGTAINYFGGNTGVGATTFGTSADKVLALGTGTAPTTGPADTIQIYSTDLSAGNTMLSIFTEGTPVNANATAAATHRIAIRVNGTVYYLLANTSA
jgi:hypothetical protein